MSIYKIEVRNIRWLRERFSLPWLNGNAQVKALKHACPDAVMCLLWVLDAVDASGVGEFKENYLRSAFVDASGAKAATRFDFLKRLEALSKDFLTVSKDGLELFNEVSKDSLSDVLTPSKEQLSDVKSASNASLIDVKTGSKEVLKDDKSAFRSVETRTAVISSNTNNISYKDSRNNTTSLSDADAPPGERERIKKNSFSTEEMRIANALKDLIEAETRQAYPTQYFFSNCEEARKLLVDYGEPAILEAMAWAVTTWEKRATVTHVKHIGPAILLFQRKKPIEAAEAEKKTAVTHPARTRFTKLRMLAASERVHFSGNGKEYYASDIEFYEENGFYFGRILETQTVHGITLFESVEREKTAS